MGSVAKAWVKFLAGAAVVLVVVLAIVRSGGSTDPEACVAATDTPCLVNGSTVRWIDSATGQYRFEGLGQWREERADAQEDQMGSPPLGPGPVGP